MNLISLISYSCVAVVSTAFGLIYLTRNQFMPYHSEALELSWSDVPESTQVLVLALMRAAGGGFLATGLTIAFLLVFPWQTGETWTIYAIPVISFCTCMGTLYATLLVKTKTPGNPPFILSLSLLFLTAIGFICSFFTVR